MDRRDFVRAGELFIEAVAAPADEASPATHQHRQLWARNAALAFWLAGDLDGVDRALAAGCSKLWPDATYSLALRQAMDLYRESGLPTDDPDRMLDVLPMAAALHVLDTPPAGPRYPLDDLRPKASRPGIRPTAEQLSGLLEQVAVRAALVMGLPLNDCELVVVAEREEPAGATMPDEPDVLGYRRGQRWVEHPRPADFAGRAGLARWLAGLAVRRRPGESIALCIGVRSGNVIAASLRATLADQHGHPAVLVAPEQAVWIDQAMKTADPAMPNGSIKLTRQQAELVVEAVRRLSGSAGNCRVQIEDDFCWVMPPAGQTNRLIPAAAGWLSANGWTMPTGPAETRPDLEPIDQPTDRDEP